MYTEKVTEQDFFQVTWEDFDTYAKKIAAEVDSFCKSENITIDFICPIVRGGSVLATYLSHMLGVIPCIGLQFKHLNISDLYETPKLLWESFSYFTEEKRNEKEYVVLVVEGNHCSGGTSLEACRILKQFFPRIKIIYSSLARDYENRDTVSEVIFNTTGYYSNESKTNYSSEFMSEHGISEKNAVFPWELIQEELDECNLVQMKIETSLFD